MQDNPLNLSWLMHNQPLTLSPDTLLREAIAQMVAQQSSCVLVVDTAASLLGIFTERDLVRLLVTHTDLSTLTLAETMSPEVMTIQEANLRNLTDVIALFHEHHIRHLPVITPSRQLVGLITPQSLRAVLEPSHLLRLKRVAEVMSYEVVHAPVATTAMELAQIMYRHQVSCVVVAERQDNGHLLPCGIVTEHDMTQFCQMGLNLAQLPTVTIMSSPLFQIHATDNLWSAHEVMKQRRVRRLVVFGEEGELIGILTQTSLLKAIDPLENHQTVKALKHLVQQKTSQLQQVNQQLQQEVIRRQQSEASLHQANQDLSKLLTNLKVTEEQLMASEKMAALGQLIAGIAHEINTPLGAIRASASNILAALQEAVPELPQMNQYLNSAEQALLFELVERSLHTTPPLTAREKRPLRQQLLKDLHPLDLTDDPWALCDRLLDLGILDNLDPFLPLLQHPKTDWLFTLVYNLKSLQTNSQTILSAVERVAKIVFALKNYARYDLSGTPQQVQIIDGIETVLEIYHNPLKRGVYVQRDYQTVPPLWVYPDELIQVWSNLIHNALHAMGGNGTLNLRVCANNTHIVVEITDSGSGIAPDIQPRIFEPFFTTKPMGEGSGLGLDICRRIVAKHEGHITLESQPGHTTFSVWLPLSLTICPFPQAPQVN